MIKIVLYMRANVPCGEIKIIGDLKLELMEDLTV